MTFVQDRLFAMQEIPYRDFSRKLVPTVDPDSIIGVRVPLIRTFAKEIKNTETAEQFLSDLPHRYLEENHLHAFLLAQMRDYSACIAALDQFLPYIDNWAVCDSLRPSAFKTHHTELRQDIARWLADPHPYTVRFAIEMLLVHFLDAEFSPDDLDAVADIDRPEYYVQMMAAWYFATALSKQYDAALPYLEQQKLPAWVHQKTIQKAVESYRISDAQKAYLKTLRHTT